MKSSLRLTATLTSTSLLLALLLSCTATQVPTGTTPDDPSASPSPDASASPVSSPAPTAVPSANTSPTATPEPSITPFPSGQPSPSSTPLPTPTPIYSSNGDNLVNLNFRARVITEGREVLPVVNTTFRADPYDLRALRQQVAARNNAGSMPVAPSQFESKYQIEEKVCTSSGCTTQAGVDMEAYQEDLNRYRNSILPDWEARAYAGLAEARSAAANGRQSLSFSTDQNGEATLRLPAGSWYFNGRYSTSGAVVIWESVPFDVLSTTRAIELVR